MCGGTRSPFFVSVFLALGWVLFFTPAPAWPEDSMMNSGAELSWRKDIESLKEILLKQIAYAQSLKKELELRKITLSDYEKTLRELRENLLNSEKRIDDLKGLLANSIESEKNLQEELDVSRSLLEALKRELAQASQSSSAYKMEAEKQIRETREERDREAAKKGIWQIVSVVLAVLAAVAAIL